MTIGTAPADATHRVWVANANDAPKWRGATTMRVEALQLGSLPSLSLIDADGDVDEWEAQLDSTATSRCPGRCSTGSSSRSAMAPPTSCYG